MRGRWKDRYLFDDVVLLVLWLQLEAAKRCVHFDGIGDLEDLLDDDVEGEGKLVRANWSDDDVLRWLFFVFWDCDLGDRLLH